MFKFKSSLKTTLFISMFFNSNVFFECQAADNHDEKPEYGYVQCLVTRSGKVVEIDRRTAATSEDCEVTFLRGQKQKIQERYHEIFKKHGTDYKAALNELDSWFYENDEFISRITGNSEFKEYRSLFNEFFIKCKSLRVNLLLKRVNEATLLEFHQQLMGQ